MKGPDMKHSIALHKGFTLVARPIYGRFILVYIEGKWWTARIRRYPYGPVLKRIKAGENFLCLARMITASAVSTYTSRSWANGSVATVERSNDKRTRIQGR